MSIAASVVIKPSRLLLLMVGVVCIGATLIGALVGLGCVGELPRWQRTFYAALCILLAMAGFMNTVRGRKTYRLDISGVGQIRLHAVATRSDADEHEPTYSHDATKGGSLGSLVTLLPDSTIWPRFLLLRLRTEDGKVYILPILPDCLPTESLRAIAVACRWIAARNLHL